LKELQLVSAALRKGDEGLTIFILFFQKGLFWVSRGDEVISKEVFFRDWET